MTHTTTDAAEARALTMAREAAALAFDERARKASHPETVTLERHYAKVIRAGEGDDYDAVQSALNAVRLATAEAASEAGEREAIAAIIDPAAMKSMEAHTAEWQAWVDEQRTAGVLPDAGRMTPDSLVRELASKDYEAQANARTLALAKADAIRSLASLPPATDPAKPAKRWGRGYPDGVPGTPEYEPPPQVCNLCGTVRSRCQCDALAAAPTIPATGKAGALAKMTALDEEIEAQHPGWMTGEATIPATGHAATEGEGA